jgi:hypothetical protein
MGLSLFFIFYLLPLSVIAVYMIIVGERMNKD